jgi:hypothetical protein
MESVGGSSETLVLTWVAVDSQTTNYLIAKRSCTLVTAYFVARPQELPELPESGNGDLSGEVDEAFDEEEAGTLTPTELPEKSEG